MFLKSNKILKLSWHINRRKCLKILESCATPNWSKGSVGQKESRSHIPSPRSSIQNSESRIPNPKFWILSPKFQIGRKKFGWKNFCQKNYHKRMLVKIIFGRKQIWSTFWPNKNSSLKKNWLKKIRVKKIFGRKINLGRKFFWPKKEFLENYFGRIFVGQLFLQESSS